MTRFLYSLILFIFFTFSAVAEIINNLKVQGNSRISDETIKVYGDIEIGKNYDQFLVNETLKKLFSTNFFEDIEILILGNTLQITVKEYPVINSIIIVGEPSKTITKSILEKLSLKDKGSFIESELNNDINLLKKNFVKIALN